MSDEPILGQDAVSAGTLLRRAREAAGMHVEALAVSLKVPVRKLEALEQDRYELLTDTVFVRALASSVCRTLNVDPQPVLDRLPRTVMPRLAADSEGINTAFRAPGDGTPPSWRQQLSRPVSLTVLVLLLGALVLIFLPGVRRFDTSALPAFTNRAEPAAVPGAAPVSQPAPGQEVTTTVAPAMATVAVDPPVAAASGTASLQDAAPSERPLAAPRADSR